MAQRKYLFLGLAAVLALAITAAFVVRELTVTDAATTEAVMKATVKSGGQCAGATCTVPTGGHFTLSVVVVSDPAAGFIGMNSQVDMGDFIDHGGTYQVATTVMDEFAWPCVAFCLRAPPTIISTTRVVSHVGATGTVPPFPTIHFTGNAIELAMTCSSGNSSSTILVPPYTSGNTNGAGFKVSQSITTPAKTTPMTLVCGVAVTPTNTPPVPTVTPTATNTPPGTPATPTDTPTPTNTPLATNTPTRTNTPGATTPPTLPPVTPTRTRTPTPSAGIHGDANCDREITSVDSLWVLWDVANLADIMCPGGLANADANKDGYLTAIDSALILQKVARLICCLPPM